jgi:hypothetical protein
MYTTSIPIVSVIYNIINLLYALPRQNKNWYIYENYNLGWILWRTMEVVFHDGK